MARTVHHVTYKHRTFTHSYDAAVARGLVPRWSEGLDSGHSLYSLRYSTAELASAAAEGRRPRPARLNLSFAAYCYPRAYGVTLIAMLAQLGNRADRRRFSTWTPGVIAELNHAARKGGLTAALEQADTDPPDGRHRHRAIWDAW